MIVSLGSTCCITQQLKNHNLRQSAYPFDWVRIINLNNISKLLDSHFSDFLNLEEMKFIEFSDRFLINNVSGSYIYKNKYCGFYHEFSEILNEKNYNSFKSKYERRIKRLFELLKSNNEIIFVREEIGKLKISKINNLINKLRKINSNMNFQIVIITSDKKCQEIYLNNVKFYFVEEKITHWTRPEIDWYKIFKGK